jgi:hypothetical protein
MAETMKISLTDEIGHEQEDIFRVCLGSCQIHGDFSINEFDGTSSAGLAVAGGAIG